MSDEEIEQWLLNLERRIYRLEDAIMLHADQLWPTGTTDVVKQKMLQNISADIKAERCR